MNSLNAKWVVGEVLSLEFCEKRWLDSIDVMNRDTRVRTRCFPHYMCLSASSASALWSLKLGSLRIDKTKGSGNVTRKGGIYRFEALGQEPSSPSLINIHDNTQCQDGVFSLRKAICSTSIHEYKSLSVVYGSHIIQQSRCMSDNHLIHSEAYLCHNTIHMTNERSIVYSNTEGYSQFPLNSIGGDASYSIMSMSASYATAAAGGTTSDC